MMTIGPAYAQINTEYPTCPACAVICMFEWDLVFDAEQVARCTCNNCGAVYMARRLRGHAPHRYQCTLLHPGTVQP
jgi:hypothetical protein